MGYRVKKVDFKKGCGWKLQLISYKDDKTKTSDIPKTDWLSHGFSPSLSFDEAKIQAASLNRFAERRRQAERTQIIKDLIQSDDDVLNKFFPQALLRDFEKLFVNGQITLTDSESDAQDKRESHWRAAKKIIRDAQIDFSDCSLTPDILWTRKVHRS